MKVRKNISKGSGKEIQWENCEYVLSIQGGMAQWDGRSSWTGL